MKDFSRKIAGLSQKRLVLLATELRSQLDELERKAQEPSAVTGVGCRFPGGANDPETFWQLLHHGVDAISEIPSQRWDVDAYYDKDVHAPGKIFTRWAGLMDRVDQFDAPFFGIAPREALTMDPQQRVLLETTWEALERAGICPEQLAGSQTGVFIGISGSDYYHLQLSGGESNIDAYFASGNAHSVASGRLSYVLGLQGLCLSVDTACSSSLVAVHLAVQSLRNRECHTALAGGVNMILSPEITIALSKAEMMAADGRCKAFDASADGFVRGEGCGVLVLKRFSDAVQDKDHVLALIRGSAINQDGKSNGLTAPNGPSQEAVIRQALENGNIGAEEIGYVEAHGTGTSLGDPIEARALGAVLGQNRSKEDPLWVGSVKTNIGHLESAAGIAGLIKIILVLQNEEIPPHLHFDTLNPLIDWDHLPLSIPTQAIKWPSGSKPRMAGVSSFGFSGTNAHIVLEEAPVATAESVALDRPLHMLTLSARTTDALCAQARQYADFLASASDSPADIFFSANTGRTQFKHRLAVIADSSEQVRQHLEAYAEGSPSDEVRWGQSRKQRGAELAFLFTGQGAQYVGMGISLYQTQPTFRRTIDQCDEWLKPLIGKSLIAVLGYSNEDPAGMGAVLDQTQYAQPILFALEYALAELWRSWGVEPTVVMGHSLGEYVAACVAGVFTLRDGLKLVTERARMMQALPESGAMLAVFAETQSVEKMIEPYHDRLFIAAYNGPANTVVSGMASDISAFVEQLNASGVSYTRLNVSHGFHSALMEPMLDGFEKAVSEISFSPPQIGVVSNLTGTLVGFEELLDPTYWRRHTRQTVRFEDSIRTLREQLNCKIFIEVGPNPVLTGMAGQILPSDSLLCLPSLRQGQNDWQRMLQSLADLHIHGYDVDWMGFDKDWPRRKVVLPTYPFERKQYWAGPGTAPSAAPAQSHDEDWRDWLYEYEWELKQSGQREIEIPAYLPEPAEIAKLVLPDFEELKAEKGINIYDAFLPRLNQLCSVYILNAFNQLGCNFNLGDRFSASEMVERLDILIQHRRLLFRMLEILIEDKIFERDGSEWVVVNNDQWSSNPELLLRELTQKYPGCSAELEMIGSCAGEIAEVMRGRSDPMALLFPNGSMALTEKMYHTSPVLQFFNSLIMRVFSSMVDRLPEDRTLRILEIGAGTGGTTRFVLPVLSETQTEYVYTDVSEMFLTRAKRTFDEYKFLDYRLLDIDADPLTQGYQSNQFDVIVAANVLHATPDVRRSLSNIRKLLVPEGMLVLLEGVDHQRFSDLTVGLTKGWWHFTDEDLRPSYALLSEGKWSQLLAETGFTDTVTMPGGLAGRDSVLSQQAVIIARGPGEQEKEIEAGNLDSEAAWLILADEAGFGQHLTGLLENKGISTLVGKKGDTFQCIDASTFSLDPSNPEHFRQLFNEIDGPGKKAIQKVVHMWAIDESVMPNEPVATFEYSQQRACGSVLHLTQVMATIPSPPRLVLVTMGAQAVSIGDKLTGVAQASLWGLGRVIALEHPEFNCIRIDLDPRSKDGNISALLNELTSAYTQDTQLALRGDQRFVLRLEKSPSSQAGGNDLMEMLQPDASYLITGGLAGLGIEVGRWMIAHGARHLILMGRSAPSAESYKIITEMEDAGAEVTVIQEDVAEYGPLEKMFSRLAQQEKNLKGIIHCAGTLDDGILLQQNWERFRNVMRAKVDGSWNLHLLSKEMDLDFFVLFSSGAAFLGSAGQGNHATANAFMDALAHHRCAHGRPALSINWGAWSQIGAATRGDVIQRMQMKGMGLIQPDQGFHVLRHLLETDPVQVGVLPIRWPELFGVMGDTSERRTFERFEEKEKPEKIAPKDAEPVFLEQLRASTPGRWNKLLLERLQQEVRKCLGFDIEQSVDTNQPLNELGLDSLMAVELRNAISLMIDTPLPATLLFNYPSMGELVQHLSKDILPSKFDDLDGPFQEMITKEGPSEADDLEHYSEEEMENLLLEKLKSQ